jgi:hypothetical protein
MEQTML